jgi:hypothetical protein
VGGIEFSVRIRIVRLDVLRIINSLARGCLIAP